MMIEEMTREKLMEALEYNPDTGVFIRIMTPGKKQYLVGKEAGRAHKSRGYREIYIGGRLHYAHRLAWMYMTGSWPIGVIDHIDHDKDNNRWANLRDVDLSTNGKNRKGAASDNKVGVLGVSHNGSGFRARIFEDGKEMHLGTFKTIDEAAAVYAEAIKTHRTHIAGEQP